MVSVTHRMHSGFQMLSYFWMKEWIFYTNNTRNLIRYLKCWSPNDLDHFNFDVRLVDWKLLFHNLALGIRRYLLKESDDNLPKAKRRLTKFVL